MGRTKRRRVGFGVALVVAGCGAATSAPPNGRVTLTGAVTGNTTVEVTAGVNGHVIGVLGWTVNMSPPLGAIPWLLFNIQLPGTSPQTGHFTEANSFGSSGQLASAVPDGEWQQEFISDGASQDEGDIDLTITSTGSPIPLDQSGGWPYLWHNAHGRLIATFVPMPVPNALLQGGNVIVTVDF